MLILDIFVHILIRPVCKHTEHGKGRLFCLYKIYIYIVAHCWVSHNNHNPICLYYIILQFNPSKNIHWLGHWINCDVLYQLIWFSVCVYQVVYIPHAYINWMSSGKLRILLFDRNSKSMDWMWRILRGSKINNVSVQCSNRLRLLQFCMRFLRITFSEYWISYLYIKNVVFAPFTYVLCFITGMQSAVEGNSSEYFYLCQGNTENFNKITRHYCKENSFYFSDEK